MRVTVLSTSTTNVPPIVDPLGDVPDVQLVKIFYDKMAPDMLPRLLARSRPDWVLYVGALPGHHDGYVPSTSELAQIGSRWPLCHICFDGAEPLWWPTLQEYYDSARFALMVNIDGVRIGPVGDRGFTTLAPVDARLYTNKQYSERPISCGFSGGLHAGREMVIAPLVQRWLLTYRERDAVGDHALYRAYLDMCRSGINCATTGGNTGALHVKHRALELAAAGCLVLEPKGSPLADWFAPGEDYIEYDGVDNATDCIHWVRRHLDEAEDMAQRMRAKVVERHSPRVFWSQVLARLGFGEPLVPPPEAPWRWWPGPPGLSAEPAIMLPPPIPPPAIPLLHVSVPQAPRAKLAKIFDHNVPFLLNSIRGHNLVQWRNRVYSVPQALGDIEIDKVDLRRFASVKVYSDLVAARQAVLR